MNAAHRIVIDHASPPMRHVVACDSFVLILLSPDGHGEAISCLSNAGEPEEQKRRSIAAALAYAVGLSPVPLEDRSLIYRRLLGELGVSEPESPWRGGVPDSL